MLFSIACWNWWFFRAVCYFIYTNGGWKTFFKSTKNRVKRKALRKAEKGMILKVYKNALELNPELPISNIKDKAAHLMGVSKASVFRVILEY